MKIKLHVESASRAPTKDLKEWAQDELLAGAGAAFYSLSDNTQLSSSEKATREKVLQVQYKRLQKLFGYNPTGFDS